VSIQKQPDPRDLRYFKFVVGRAQGADDHRIVEELNDPDIDSPQVLYRSLHRDNYPVCPMCGAAPVQAGHCQEEVPKRQPRKTGSPRDLPPASDAMPLFQERIEALTRVVEGLPHLVETS
jgi:hypothetical protein